MTHDATYRVKEVAELTGVTVRTLHHYDEIGLLVPSRRSRAGYRLYTGDDLLRLQQILIGRALGLTLEAIGRSLDDPRFERRAALEAQRAQLVAQAERARAMLRAVDAALAALDDGGQTMKDMTRDEVTALFDGFDPARFEDEATRRWGDTEAYAESARRTARYTKADWARYKTEADDIMRAAAALLLAGEPTDGERARDVVERHRLSIDRWFYPCSPEMHARLAEMYEADPRFAANIDAHAVGLTSWLSAAIRACA